MASPKVTAKRKTPRGRRSRAGQAFLDTSVLYADFFGHELQKTAIKRRIGNRRKIACRYVLTEVHNQSLPLIRLYFSLKSGETLVNAFAVIAAGYSDRQTKMILQAMGRVMGQAASASERLAALANVIYGYIEIAEAIVSEFAEDKLGCPLALAGFSNEPGLTDAERFQRFRVLITCVINESAKCKSDEFRASNADRIERVRVDAQAASRGIVKLRAFLEKLAAGTISHARGLRYRCSKIADLLIALQCPSKATIVALDEIYRDLGRVLNRSVEIVPSLQALNRGVK